MSNYLFCIYISGDHVVISINHAEVCCALLVIIIVHIPDNLIQFIHKTFLNILLHFSKSFLSIVFIPLNPNVLELFRLTIVSLPSSYTFDTLSLSPVQISTHFRVSCFKSFKILFPKVLWFIQFCSLSMDSLIWIYHNFTEYTCCVVVRIS